MTNEELEAALRAALRAAVQDYGAIIGGMHGEIDQLKQKLATETLMSEKLVNSFLHNQQMLKDAVAAERERCIERALYMADVYHVPPNVRDAIAAAIRGEK